MKYSTDRVNSQLTEGPSTIIKRSYRGTLRFYFSDTSTSALCYISPGVSIIPELNNRSVISTRERKKTWKTRRGERVLLPTFVSTYIYIYIVADFLPKSQTNIEFASYQCHFHSFPTFPTTIWLPRCTNMPRRNPVTGVEIHPKAAGASPTRRLHTLSHDITAHWLHTDTTD